MAGHSTLLQVLISIQSLILCEEPYLNEPGGSFGGNGADGTGWAGQSGVSLEAGQGLPSTNPQTRRSEEYSANVRRMVLVDAMGNNLRNPPYPFEDVIKTHFRLKANAIRAQLDKWVVRTHEGTC